MGYEHHFLTIGWRNFALMLSRAFQIMDIVAHRLCLIFKGEETKTFTMTHY